MKQRSAAKPAAFSTKKGEPPLYHRVYLLLLQNISDRSFPPGQPMPSEIELSQRLGVSRITLRAALERLEREGLVQRQRGRGTFPVPAQLANLKGMPSGLRNQVSLALKTSVRVLDHGMVSASAAIAGLLEIEAGEQILRVVRVRSDSSSPISHSVCHVPKDLADLLPRQQIRALPISTILASSGVSLDRVREYLSASIADTEIAKCLDVEVGSPLLSLVRTVSTSDNRVVEHLRVLYRPDRYEYRVEYSTSEANESSPSWRATIADLTT